MFKKFESLYSTGREKTIRVLIENGADSGIKDDYGRSPESAAGDWGNTN